MQIGAQFYTLRDYCKTLDDFALSLKKVADIGYRTVQISGVCKYDAKWLDAQLKANGLKCVLTHYDTKRIAEDTQNVIKEHDIFGCRYIGIGSMPGGINPQSYDNFVKNYKPTAAEIKNAGKLLMYHNHHREFEKAPDGKLYIEKLAEDFAKDELGFTLDTYWIKYAGYDPAEWIRQLKDRVPCIHLKDMKKRFFLRRMAPVGDGCINFDEVIKSANDAGTKYLLVEQDYCYGKNPFDCLKKSYEYLKAQGLE